mmetsp:Transcript_16267/g.18422  ORF Transcript_16267/g.18422 Transcript_16267/m.18422 type:complete len:192 (+) Transcript_16267:127-702(+)
MSELASTPAVPPHEEDLEEESEEVFLERVEKEVQLGVERDTKEILNLSPDGEGLKQDRIVGLATVKRIMKLDEEVKVVRTEAAVLLCKASELILGEMAIRANNDCLRARRKIIKKVDVVTSLKKSDMFDFLIDILPSNVEAGKLSTKNDVSTSETPSNQVASKSVESWQAYQKAFTNAGVSQFIPSGRNDG